MMTFVLLALLAQTCSTPDPFVAIGGGTCLGAGWVPSSLVVQGPPSADELPGLMTPPPQNGQVPLPSSSASWPSGQMLIEAPLTLLDYPLVNGHSTVVKASDLSYQGTVLNIQTSLPGNPDTGYPQRTVIRDVMVTCPPGSNQIGIAIRGANIVLENVTVAGCAEGIRCEHCVDVTLENPNILQNTTGLFLAGWAHDTVTALMVRGGMIGASRNAVVIRHGRGVTFDGTKIQYNQGCGINVTATELNDVDVQARDVWFEQNAGGHLCGLNRVVLSGSTSAR